MGVGPAAKICPLFLTSFSPTAHTLWLSHLVPRCCELAPRWLRTPFFFWRMDSWGVLSLSRSLPDVQILGDLERDTSGYPSLYCPRRPSLVTPLTTGPWSLWRRAQTTALIQAQLWPSKNCMLNPDPQNLRNVTVFIDTAFARIIKIKTRSCWCTLVQYDCSLA